MARKKRKIPRFLVFSLLLCLTAFFVLQVVQEVQTTASLKNNIAESLKKKNELNEKKQKLVVDKKNLENPEYILRYVRGKYLVTKEDGEQVFKLPDDE